MNFVSWNVNGLRACLKKGFLESVAGLNADFLCLQETKMERGQAQVDLPGYHEFWNSADKKGYSGTAVFARREPVSVSYGMDLDKHDHEGRLITLEYPKFWLVNCYTPNAQDGLARIDYRMEWEDDLREYLLSLDKTKPVVYCGDLNVAHEEIDLKNPKTNRGNAGFSDQERDKMTRLLSSGFVDTFRLLYPERTGAYSWWSYRFHARENNAGWRIDYFIVSQRLAGQVRQAAIHPEIFGSDHCPVSLTLDLD
ncbi:MAG TPA: exodeoxyribonuclease III [Candidatus Enterenecus stercoripullorum]|nr:exodeoxyribonuclease III [Candidatus Enterenecus stercoripullorum]